MINTRRTRRITGPGAVTIAILTTALALTACGADDFGDGDGDGVDTVASTTPSTDTDPAPDTDTGTDTQATTAQLPTATDDATIDGQPATAAARELGDELSSALVSVRDEFGEVGVDLLQIYPDYWSLYYVDPAEPDSRKRAEFRGSAWSELREMPRPDDSSLLQPDAIDPSILRDAVEAAPGLLEIDDARLSHVSVSPDDSGQAEYLIALATDNSLGTATFGPDGQMREARPPR